MKILALLLSLFTSSPPAVFDVSYEENHHGGELPENQAYYRALSWSEANLKVQELLEMADSYPNDVMVIRVEKLRRDGGGE